MKFLLFAPIALFLCSFHLGEKRKSPESVPNVSVNYIKEDKNLEAGTGMVLFSFQSNYGWVKGDTVRMSFNGKEEKVVPSQDGKVYMGMKSGKYVFQFFLNQEHYEIKTDSILIKEQWQTGMLVTFESSRIPVMAEKPVIYIYPDATKEVSISLNVNGTIGFVYPSFNNAKIDTASPAWHLKADPDGTINMNNKQYDYLFYDALTYINVTKFDQNEGFLVKRDSLADFFEEKLTAMGLNPREREDFITYWAPQMQKNETSLIHFMFTEEYDQVATISVNPKPDHLFRVFMLWDEVAQLDTSKVRDQKIESFTRDGFTVVEWGGAKVDFLATKQKIN